jgi:hypothetical protein
MSKDPHRYHSTQLSACRVRVEQLNLLDIWLSRARLATALALVGLAFASLWQGWLSIWWLLPAGVFFIVLVVSHDRFIRAQRIVRRRVRRHELGLARIEDRWIGMGETGERFNDEEHPYACDLNIFGDGSLFQLLTTAQTMAGEETLARWLLGGADIETVHGRQKSVRELSVRQNLLEDLYALGVDVRAEVDSSQLVTWAKRQNLLATAGLRVFASALSITVVTAISAWLAGLVPGVVPLGFVLTNVGVGMFYRRAVNRILHGSSEPSRELEVLATVLERLDRESFKTDQLKQLSGYIGTQTDNPTRSIRQLSYLIQMHDWQHNLLFAPVAAVMLWGLHCAAAVEAWRNRHGDSVEVWLRVVGEFEALASIASHHFSNPGDPFPELVPSGEVPIYEAEGLTHPILPRASAVANDIAIGGEPQLCVVSGSNMSGKTTLLRTVGINAVMAFVGAPVRARRLKLSPLVIGATLHVQDSLLKGQSRFYAEITRLRRLVDLAKGATPLLFLFDELFHGTNSHDRVAGASGILHFFLDHRSIGLVTTHDLALAGIADRLALKAINVHFEDQFTGGEMTFDYHLRSGRATRSNALALMTAVGLDVSR